MKLLEVLEKNKKIYRIVQYIYKIPIDAVKYLETIRKIQAIQNKEKVIFYLGIPVYSNIGDLAQGMCIRRWINKNYQDYSLCEIETNALVHTHFSVIKKLKRVYKKGNIIIFQSGYTTTDLGGYADEMHRRVIQNIPEANFLMMPQTIYFSNDNNKKRTADIYNSAKKMLFLARDKISYEMALGMFPDLRVELYPDIVTTLIGSKNYNKKKEGIIFCCREDSEKYYSDEEINALIKKCIKFGKIDRTDTSKRKGRAWIVRNSENLIKEEIENYAEYRVVVTDRYHGTIFSLIAGTPVVVLKTTDHKVITGTEWFKGVYDNFVFVAKDLNDAYEKIIHILNSEDNPVIRPFFEEKFYDRLKDLFDKAIEQR